MLETNRLKKMLSIIIKSPILTDCGYAGNLVRLDKTNYRSVIITNPSKSSSSS